MVMFVLFSTIILFLAVLLSLASTTLFQRLQFSTFRLCIDRNPSFSSLILFLFMQHFGFRSRSAPGPRPIRAEGCAATRKVPEGVASRALWTHLLQVQVTPQEPLPLLVSTHLLIHSIMSLLKQ